jgi:hypothetical protein
MMYFEYTYAPNLTNQMAYVITEKYLRTIHMMAEYITNATHQTTYLQH